MNASFCLVGAEGSGKSTLMGQLLFDLGAVEERQKQRCIKEEPQDLTWQSKILMQRPEELSLRHTIVPRYWELYVDRNVSLALFDSPGRVQFVKNLARAIFGAQEALLVVDGSQDPNLWRNRVDEICSLVAGMGRTIGGVLVAQISADDDALFLRAKEAVAEILLRHATVLHHPNLHWRPQNHHLFSAPWRRAIVAFVLVNRRFMQQGHGLPKDVVKLIVAMAAKHGGDAEYVNAAKQVLDEDSLLFLLRRRCKAQEERKKAFCAELNEPTEVFAVYRSLKIMGIGFVVEGHAIGKENLEVGSKKLYGIGNSCGWENRSLESHYQPRAQVAPGAHCGIHVCNSEKQRPQESILFHDKALASKSICQITMILTKQVRKGSLVGEWRLHVGFAVYQAKFVSQARNGSVTLAILSPRAYFATNGELSFVLATDERRKPAFYGIVTQVET